MHQYRKFQYYFVYILIFWIYLNIFCQKYDHDIHLNHLIQLRKLHNFYRTMHQRLQRKLHQRCFLIKLFDFLYVLQKYNSFRNIFEEINYKDKLYGIIRNSCINLYWFWDSEILLNQESYRWLCVGKHLRRLRSRNR